jgi:hypothetical protein
MAEELDTLDVINALTHTERVFYSNMRYLDSATRNNVILAHQRNMRDALGILRSYIDPPIRAPPRAQHMVFNIPLTFDGSGNFFDPVPVYPTAAQIANAVETRVAVADTTCAICQEAVTLGTRLRHCGHCFHGTCIAQWFTMSTRCPVCRHDIRQFTQTARQTNNDSSVHTN